jgi:hypothetical protein
MTGFIHILRSDDPQRPNFPEYIAMFAPVGPTGTGGSIKGKKLADLDALVRFLGMAHIGEISIREAKDDLRLKGNASIAYVDLSENELRALDLI